MDAPAWGEVLEWSDERAVPARALRPRPSGPQARAESFAWALFSAGGFVAAVLIPVHVAILGIAYAAGWLPHDALSYQRVHHLVGLPLVRLYLWGIISLPLFHWAHRFRFAIHHQFGIHWRKLVALACYGTAMAGTVLSAVILLRI
jgi:succinate dehydrogenase subunit D